MRSKNRFSFRAVFLSTLLGLSLSPSVHAENVVVSLRTLSQVQRERGGTHQVPVNEYFSLGVSELPRNSSFDLDFRSMGDLATEATEFDLYQATLHVEPLSTFQMDGGRLWLNDGFDSALLDGARFAIAPDGAPLGVNFYWGVPRYLDEGDFVNVTEGMVTGFQLYLRDVKDTAAQFSFRYRKNDITQRNFKENDSFGVALAASHQFTSFWATPNLYSNFEMDLPDQTVEVATLGAAFYPHWRVVATVEGNYYDAARNFQEATLLGQYVTDQLMMGFESAEIKLPWGFRLFENFAFSRFDATAHNDSNGYRAGVGVGHYSEPAKLSTSGEFYYADSYGGRVTGGLAELSNQSLKNLEISTALDVSRYTKITNQEDTALSWVTGVAYEFSDDVHVELGGEYNHNNWFDREGRVTVGLTVGLKTTKKPLRQSALPMMRGTHEI